MIFFLTIAFLIFANCSEVPQGDSRPHLNLHPHHKRDSESKHTETSTMSSIQLQQIITAAKITFESMSKSGIKSEEQNPNELEVDEIEDLWACTEISLKNETCYLVSSFKISLKPMSCTDVHLKVLVLIENRNQELFLTQNKRMLAKDQDKSATCSQRLKKFSINEGFRIVVLDNKVQMVNTNEIESHIFWSLLKSYEIHTCFFYKIGVLDLETDEFFKFKFFTIISALFVWSYCIYKAKVKFSKYLSKKKTEEEEEEGEKKKKEKKEKKK